MPEFFLSDIENTDTQDPTKIYFFRNVISESLILQCIKNNKKIDRIQTTLSASFNVEFKSVPLPKILCRTLVIPLKNLVIDFSKNDKTITYDCSKGDCIYYYNGVIKIKDIDNRGDFIFLSYFNQKESLLNTNYRELYAETVKKQFVSVKSKKVFQQNIEEMLYPIKKIGEGNYGTVYSAIGWEDTNLPFAVKYGIIKDEGINNYNEEITSYHEKILLERIISPIITNGVCPNLPLLIDCFITGECKTLPDRKCSIVSLLEVADGNLRQLFFSKKEFLEEDMYNCLFQIMAGLHATQAHAQIMNFDIKAENILYFKIPKGGCWKYTILDKTFYLPNNGWLFILNDFGLSRSMNPDLVLPKNVIDTLRLGSRFAIVKKGKFWPIQNKTGKEIIWEEKTTDGSTISSSSSHTEEVNMTKDKVIKKQQNNLSEKQEKYLEKMGIPTDYRDKEYYKHPMIIPPFEFYNDTMDVIRMFVGGKRTTQKKNHAGIIHKERYKNFISKLKKYNFSGENCKARKFPTDVCFVLAGYFITDFFKDMYQEKETYVLQTFKI